MLPVDELRASLAHLETILCGMTKESEDVNLWKVANSVLRWGYWVLQTRHIPGGRFKALEMVIRCLEGLASQRWNYTPEEVMAWRDAHGHRLRLLHEALDWGERSLGCQMSDCGGVVLHNTAGVSAERFRVIQTQVADVSRVIRATRDHHRVLFGSLYLAGQILPLPKFKERKAWYDIDRDEIYFRDVHQDTRLMVAHELGHRYWYQFMDQPRRDRVETLYHTLLQESAKMSLPTLHVGDIFPIPLDNKGTRPTMTEITQASVSFDNGWRMSRRSIERTLAEEVGVGTLFPSWYSRKDVSEFFAECFSHDVVGGMPHGLRDRWDGIA